MLALVAEAVTAYLSAGVHTSHRPFVALSLVLPRAACACCAVAGAAARRMRAQGEKFLDSLDDVAVPSVVLIDGMAIWGPLKSVGLTELKLWLAGWMQRCGTVNVAVTASTATPTSNKVGVLVWRLVWFCFFWGGGGGRGGGRCVAVAPYCCSQCLHVACCRTMPAAAADRCSCASRCC
jgi:uncharacterized membrane protein